MPRVDFWYEFASNYSYLAAMRIEPLAQAARVTLRWRPFLLGPIFKAQGWESSPFNIFPTKGRYTWRDMERLASRFGLGEFVRPAPFPANSLLAARVALALDDAARPAFSRAVFRTEFAEGKDISDRGLIASLLRTLGHDSEAVLARAGEDEIKAALRAETDLAQAIGIFGAPTFVTEDGELFWGNDRLEQALDWAASRALELDQV